MSSTDEKYPPLISSIQACPVTEVFQNKEYKFTPVGISTLIVPDAFKYRVGIGRLTASDNGTFYQVTLDRPDRPLDAKPWDGGRITPFQSANLENVTEEARMWAEFLDAKLTYSSDKVSPGIQKEIERCQQAQHAHDSLGVSFGPEGRTPEIVHKTDGPVLLCSDGCCVYLSWWHRFNVYVKNINAEGLNKLHLANRLSDWKCT